MKKKKLSLADLKVESFITSTIEIMGESPNFIGGGNSNLPCPGDSLANCFTELAKCPSFDKDAGTGCKGSLVCPNPSKMALCNKGPQDYSYTYSAPIEQAKVSFEFAKSLFAFYFMGC